MTAHEQGVGLPGDWARKHYKQVIVIRGLLAPWILFVTVFRSDRFFRFSWRDGSV